ncbi:cobyrinate a,c-diamide synthase [Pseudobacillus badius]|uniref:cobyrinate a,c-diamide synthase n=1 Tax=Bacillus badius TaxID=1455 RepID=UPI0005ADC93D|nr:cobyrinate a,c-diamide synthase [Bacillus badius]KIL74603.1 Cobyrinic acid A,C-diamide synthase [Bacillus badius]KZR58759.1 cobyrinic acid a,c-diamide synthase [Bacillus badius]
MGQRRIMIAGTSSGAGKTTVTLGLMAAFHARGRIVQGFKCGPDYIDPAYHTAVTGRTSRNLDSWMLDRQTVKEVYVRGAAGAEISIMEGVMGYFDGRDPLTDEGSSADISRLLDCPVLLVVNCASMARSAAAIVKGFQLMDAGSKIAGVIANRVGSESHYQLVKAAIEQECGLPVVGYLKKNMEAAIPERHLGLLPSVERGELDPLFQTLGELVSAAFDLDEIWKIAEAPAIEEAASSLFAKKKPATVKIAVARDAAFNFYYKENLELLEATGAELSFFSPLADEPVPQDAAGLYIGGGFPEEFAARLAENEQARNSIRLAAESGMPVLAECGGFMYLTQSIEDTAGRVYPMAGVIPGRTKMQKRLAALGYRELTGLRPNFLLPAGEKARGHEFHYSTFLSDNPPPAIWQASGRKGTKEEGCLLHHVAASYIHFHFASSPEMAARFVAACEKYKENLQVMGREDYALSGDA